MSALVRRRRVVPAVALLAVVLAALVRPVPATADTTPAPVRILIVGDSITQGSAGDWTWRYRLWQHLRQDGVSVDFVGPHQDLFDNLSNTSGSQAYLDPAFDRDHAARWGMTFLAQDVPIGQLVATYHPDVVVELLGFNDLRWEGMSPAAVDGELRTFIADARAASPAVDVVASRVPETWTDGVPGYDDLVGATAAELDTPDARVVAASPEVGFAENADTWDGVHPDAEGELKIAAAMADALSRLGVGSAYPRPLPVLPLGPRVAATLRATEGNGQAGLAWSGSPGSTGEYVWTRDVTAAKPWQRLPYALTGTRWTAGALVNGHRYELKLQPLKGWHDAAADVRSNVVSVVPHSTAAFALRAWASVGGTAHLTWARVPGASSYSLEVRDDSAGGGWRQARAGIRSPAALGGLLNTHRYSFRVEARFASGPVSSVTRTAVVPALPAVTQVRAGSPDRDRVVVRGLPVAVATSYRGFVVPVRTCGAVPSGARFRLVRTGLAHPGFGFHTRASHVWVRLRAVRAGVLGTVVRSSSTCLRVR